MSVQNSVILAPFNSTRTHISSQMHDSVKDFIIEKKRVMRFEVKVRELDRQYEMNNNGELDNGVYNKFVNNSIRNDDDGDKANEELISNPSTFVDQNSNEDYLKQLNAVFSGDKRDIDRNKSVHPANETVVSNYNFKIDQDAINKVVQKFKYPRDYVTQWLDMNEANYCTTTYYLLITDQNY